jgi:signal-transduction protein with cAMP-binding, CBS, and nucleotidyltransferase domain
MDGGRLAGIMTDRDIAIRVIAENKPPETPVPQAYSGADLATVTPDTVLEQAAELMRSKAIRRLPVVDGGRPAGIVSIGDLAIERNDTSALPTSAPPNPTGSPLSPVGSRRRRPRLRLGAVRTRRRDRHR